MSKWEKYADLWIEEYKNGMSTLDIARKYNTHRSVICRWFQAKNFKTIRQQKQNNKNICWKGYGGLSGKFWGSIKSSAIVRGIPFNITVEDAWEQWLKQDGKCAYTGRTLDLCKLRKDFQKITASLDRIDSLKPYEKGNIQWVEKKINIMKHLMSDKEFVETCCLIADRKKNIL